MQANCLIGLGSNVGDREAALRGAFDAIDALPNVKLLRQSRLYRTAPIGGPSGQQEFLNAAAVVETQLEPLALLDKLQRIENQFGRERRERWSARTLDIDLLLAGDTVIESPELTVPHPRMSFRRFVLEPSAEIAGEMVHPTIGWSIRELWEHLDSASDRLVILSPDEALRRDVAELLVERCRGQIVPAPQSSSGVSQLWPPTSATWLKMPTQDEVAEVVADNPKLTIEIDLETAVRSAGSRPSGRGPTLALKSGDRRAIEAEVMAAVGSVWSGHTVR